MIFFDSSLLPSLSILVSGNVGKYQEMPKLIFFSSFIYLFSSFLSPVSSGGGFVAYSESQSDGFAIPNINQSECKKKRVVVLGTGWAATSFLKDLDVSSYDVQVVSPRNYFAFTPLLPSVTCGTVEARSIVEPVRNIIKKVADFSPFNTFFVLCE